MYDTTEAICSECDVVWDAAYPLCWFCGEKGTIEPRSLWRISAMRYDPEDN